jgi:ATP-binding cassette subfamily C protein
VQPANTNAAGSRHTSGSTDPSARSRRLSHASRLAAKSRAFFESATRDGVVRSRRTLRDAAERVRPLVFSPRARRGLAAYNEKRSEFFDFLGSCRQAFWGLAIFSGLSNILMLTGSFFMLQVYDRVLPSRSIPTLVGLIILAGGLYVEQGFLDLIRSRILIHIGSTLY